MPLRYISHVITIQTTNGSKTITALKERSGPSNDALICFALAELQKGHAAASTDNTVNNIINK